jgi:hypothetical protein
MHLPINPQPGTAKPVNRPPGPPQFASGYLPPGCDGNSGIPCPPTGFLGLPSDQGPQGDMRGGTLSRIGNGGNGSGGWPGPAPIPVYPSPAAQGTDPFLCVAHWIGVSPTVLAIGGGLALWLWASGAWQDVMEGIAEGVRGR